MTRNSISRRRLRNPGLSLEPLENRMMLSGPGDDVPGLDSHGVELSRFASAQELEQFLVEAAPKTYGVLFGQPTWYGPWWPVPLAGNLEGPGFREMDAAQAAPAAPDHSETNTQVAGVDEADLVETDGDYLYILSGRDVVIAKAGSFNDAGQWTADGLQVTSRVDIDGQPIGQYLSGDHLTVVSHVLEPYVGIPEPWLGGPAIDVMPYPQPIYQPQVKVTVLDVADRSAAKVVQETDLDGTYIDSRAIGNLVYVVTSDNFALPAPQTLCDPSIDTGTILPPDLPRPVLFDAPVGVAIDVEPFWRPPEPTYQCVYETEQQYRDRIEDKVLELALPHYASYNADGELTESGLLSEPTDIYKPVLPEDSNLISVSVFDVTSVEPGPASSTSVPTSYTNELYASTDSLYLLNPDWGGAWGGGQETSIFRLDLDGTDVDLTAVGQVPGRVLNSFSVDEYNDQLRIATSQGWGRETDNRVFVLEDSDVESGRLDVVGRSDKLAPGEQIFSVRFMEETAYVVTFLRTDPLFVLDLSDSAKPKKVGELHIPGFSNYLHPAGDHHLIGIGNDADEATGRVTGLQVSLFDVTDPSGPELAGRYSFDLPGWAWSEANNDHHAVGYYPEDGVLAIPVSNGGGWIEVDRDGDGRRDLTTYRPRTDLWVFQIDTSGTSDEPIKLLGQIEHDAEVRRSVRIEDLLYSISNVSAKVHPLDEPGRELGQLYFGQQDVGVPVFQADENDARVRFAVEVPERAAPQVVDVNVGSTLWDGDFVNLLEARGTADDQSRPPEILPFASIDQIKVTFSEDVLVGRNDLMVRGASEGSYPIRDFTYSSEIATAVWTLGKPLEPDSVSIRVRDAVGDLRRNALDGNQDAREGGSFVHQFRVLPGDLNRDGQVDRADLVAAMSHSSTSVDDPGYLLSADIDGNGTVDTADFMAIGRRSGTALPDATVPRTTLGDANDDGVFDRQDIVHVLQRGKYLTDQPATYRDGDFNGDGRFDQLDLVTVLQDGKYASEADAVDRVDGLFEKMGADELVF